MEIKKLLATAATGREVMGTTFTSVRAKDAGKTFALTGLDPEQMVATLTEVLPEDAPEGTEAESIPVNESMQDSFKYGMNPNPKPVPVATVENGGLVVGTYQVPMGDLLAKEVLAVVENNVLLTTEAEDGVTMQRYIVDQNKFINLGKVNDVSVIETGGMIILQDTFIEDVELKDENGKPTGKTRPVLRSNRIGQFTDRGIVKWIDLGEPFWDEDDEDYYDEETSPEYFLPVSQAKLISFGKSSTLALVSTQAEDEDGYLVDSPDSVVYLIKVNPCKYYNKEWSEISTSAPIAVALSGTTDMTVTITMVDKIHIGWVVKTAKELVLYVPNAGITFRTDKPAVLAALKGYDEFAGTYRKKVVGEDDRVTEVLRYKFCNENYETRAVTIRPLGDGRGNEITVE